MIIFVLSGDEKEAKKVASILEEAGHKAMILESLHRCLDAAKSNEPDMIIVDADCMLSSLILLRKENNFRIAVMTCATNECLALMEILNMLIIRKPVSKKDILNILESDLKGGD